MCMSIMLDQVSKEYFTWIKFHSQNPWLMKSQSCCLQKMKKLHCFVSLLFPRLIWQFQWPDNFCTLPPAIQSASCSLCVMWNYFIMQIVQLLYLNIVNVSLLPCNALLLSALNAHAPYIPYFTVCYLHSGCIFFALSSNLNTLICF